MNSISQIQYRFDFSEKFIKKYLNNWSFLEEEYKITTEQIIGIISIIVVTISVKYFWRYTQNKVKKEVDSNVIKQPSTYLLISIMCTVGTTVIVGVLLLTTNAFEQEGWFAGITVFALMYL